MKRENVVTLTGAAVWAPARAWTLSLGAGAEIDGHETLFVGRFGAEYGFERPEHWELAIAASYLNREIYDVVAIGLVVGRRFGGAVRGR